MSFGSLAHEVLREFGASAAAASTDARGDPRAAKRLARRAGAAPVRRRSSGRGPRAGRAASRAAGRLRPLAGPVGGAGWRIQHVEIGEERAKASLVVDGRAMGIRGRIDRIDFHPSTGRVDHLRLQDLGRRRRSPSRRTARAATGWTSSCRSIATWRSAWASSGDVQLGLHRPPQGHRPGRGRAGRVERRGLAVGRPGGGGRGPQGAGPRSSGRRPARRPPASRTSRPFARRGSSPPRFPASEEGDGPVSRTPLANLVIRASAGTGKTYQLSNRFLGLVAADGEPLDSILATTFTRKAAGEILARVLVATGRGGCRSGQAQAARREHRVAAGPPAVRGPPGRHGPPPAPAPRQHAGQLLPPSGAELQPGIGAAAGLADRGRGRGLALAGRGDPRRARTSTPPATCSGWCTS